MPPVKLCRFVKPVPSVWREKTVPLSLLAVPYIVLLDKTKPDNGPAPSLPPVKSYNVVNVWAKTLPAGTRSRPAVSKDAQSRFLTT